MYQTLQTIWSTTIALTDIALHFGALEIGAHVPIMTVESIAQYAWERVSLGGCIKLWLIYDSCFLLDKVL